MRLSISLSEVRDSWRSKLPRYSPDIPPWLPSPAGDPDCSIWNSAAFDVEGSFAPRTVCGAVYLCGRETFSLRVSSCIVPSPNRPPIMGPSNRIANYRVREPGNRYAMIEFFCLLQIGHCKTDHFLLPVVVRCCHGRISPIPVKGPAIKAGRMVVYFRRRGARTRGCRSELRRLAWA